MIAVHKVAYIMSICLFQLHVAAQVDIGTFFSSSQILFIIFFIILYTIFHLFY